MEIKIEAEREKGLPGSIIWLIIDNEYNNVYKWAMADSFFSENTR